MFNQEVVSELGYYVYRLIDPRNGDTFYVGRGKGNRVFAHLNEALKFEGEENELTTKLNTITQIKNAGLQPLHIIHRHALTLDEAKEVEASLIDVFPGLSNIQNGYDSGSRGPMNAKEIMSLYALELIPDNCNHNFVAINIRKSINDLSIYDAVRCCWRVSLERVQRAELIFAVTNQVCRKVFIAEEWLEATKDNFSGLLQQDIPGRYGFVGSEASSDIANLYLNKKLPQRMERIKGNASPVLYSYK